MTRCWKWLLVGFALFTLSPALAAKGSWKFKPDSQDNPILTYSENGKTVFMIGCGRAFGLQAKYPGTSKKTGKATITITNSKARMKIDGGFAAPDEDSATDFLQWDLGFRRQDPELYGRKWNRIKSRLLGLIGSGETLTLSAQGRSYKLPPVNASDWEEPFDACGR
jgi:hypothetical protein